MFIYQIYCSNIEKGEEFVKFYGDYISIDILFIVCINVLLLWSNFDLIMIEGVFIRIKVQDRLRWVCFYYRDLLFFFDIFWLFGMDWEIIDFRLFFFDIVIIVRVNV